MILGAGPDSKRGRSKLFADVGFSRFGTQLSSVVALTPRRVMMMMTMMAMMMMMMMAMMMMMIAAAAADDDDDSGDGDDGDGGSGDNDYDVSAVISARGSRPLWGGEPARRLANML